jgi:hypothetical protein
VWIWRLSPSSGCGTALPQRALRSTCCAREPSASWCWISALGLAQKHQAVVLCLTSRAGGPLPPRNLSLGSLVGWRGDAWRKPLENGAFLCGLRILKDKRRGPSWSHEAIYRGPPGLS